VGTEEKRFGNQPAPGHGEHHVMLNRPKFINKNTAPLVSGFYHEHNARSAGEG